MKKILILVVASMFTAAAAYAEVRIGASVALTMLESSGTETTKSSSEKNTGSKDSDVIVPALFLELANSKGIALGIDYTPADSDLGSGTGDDDDEETSGANKASAELTGHTTVYALLPVGSAGAYLKFGVARASIDTTETLATGTTYGNADVDGKIIGLGLNRQSDTGGFFRMEGTYTDYDEVTFNGSLDSDSVRNIVNADVDALALRIAVGKAF